MPLPTSSTPTPFNTTLPNNSTTLPTSHQPPQRSQSCHTTHHPPSNSSSSFNLSAHPSPQQKTTSSPKSTPNSAPQTTPTTFIDEPTLAETLSGEKNPLAHDTVDLRPDKVKDGYLGDITKKVVEETKYAGSLPTCYRNGKFWIRPKDPYFAVQNAKKKVGEVGQGFGADVVGTQCDVFVWIPKLLIDGKALQCSEYQHDLQGNNDIFSAHFFLTFQLAFHRLTNRAGFALRRVVNTPRPYWLLGQRLHCPTPHGPLKKSKNYMRWSPEILAQLPMALRMSFPGAFTFFSEEGDTGRRIPPIAFLTRRGATDKTLLRLVRIIFSDGLGSEAASDLCLKLSALDHDDRQLLWTHALKDLPPHRWPKGDLAFPPFDQVPCPQDDISKIYLLIGVQLFVTISIMRSLL